MQNIFKINLARKQKSLASGHPCVMILIVTGLTLDKSLIRYCKSKDNHKVLNGSGVDFINVLRTAFSLVDPESVKNTVKSSASFYAFGIYERKSCT